MSLASLEREILYCLRIITKTPKLRNKDIMEWCTSEEPVRKNATPGETIVFCPQLGIWAAIKEGACKKVAP